LGGCTQAEGCGGQESCAEKEGEEEGWARKGIQGCGENEEASGQAGGGS
jgi:hypothetical protein